MFFTIPRKYAAVLSQTELHRDCAAPLCCGFSENLHTYAKQTALGGAQQLAEAQLVPHRRADPGDIPNFQVVRSEDAIKSVCDSPARYKKHPRCASATDSATFRFKLHDDVTVTCAALAAKHQPLRNNLCERGRSEAGHVSRGEDWPAESAAESCPQACSTCKYEAFSHGRLKLKAPLRIPETTSRVFVKAWSKLGQRYPIARTIILVDVPFQRELHHPRYDALYVMGDNEAAREIWRRGGASLVVEANVMSATRALPFAERAADIVVADLSAPRATGASVLDLRKYLVELVRVLADGGPLVLLNSKGLNINRWIAGQGGTAKSRVDLCRASPPFLPSDAARRSPGFSPMSRMRLFSPLSSALRSSGVVKGSPMP